MAWHPSLADEARSALRALGVTPVARSRASLAPVPVHDTRPRTGAPIAHSPRPFRGERRNSVVVILVLTFVGAKPHTTNLDFDLEGHSNLSGKVVSVDSPHEIEVLRQRTARSRRVCSTRRRWAESFRFGATTLPVCSGIINLGSDVFRAGGQIERLAEFPRSSVRSCWAAPAVHPIPEGRQASENSTTTRKSSTSTEPVLQRRKR